MISFHHLKKLNSILDDYLRGSALERAQVYEIMTRVGALTPDEIRMEEDMIR
jgi:hypothetical protein